MEILLRKEYSKFINYWLIILLFLIGLIVVIGGLTRLTDSGLSITKWDIVSGILPPLNRDEWIEAFNLYKEIPQYYLLNPSMTMKEFKIIYYWEYLHRILGRILGLCFLIPFIFIYMKKILNNQYNLNFFILFLLILVQGTIGWYMVKSGLTENTTVSHYRLAIHLNLALILFSAVFWYFLNINSNRKEIFFNFKKENIFPKVFIFLLFLQITFGAFTSGLDAGRIYQTWPLMNNNVFPDDISINSFIFSQIFNDPSFIQFIHRKLAYLIFIFALFISIYVFYKKKNYLYNPVFFLLIMVSIQIMLGIFTLLSGLSVVIASLHQISTIFLLISSIYFYFKCLKR